MKSKYVYVLIGVLLIIGIIIFFNQDNYTNNLKRVELNSKNTIHNRTKTSSLDTIYDKGLKILGIEGEVFLITEISDNQKSIFNDDFNLRGTVIERDGYFLIKTELGSNKTLIDIASHELIHVKQMVDGKFKYGDGGIYYNGEFINLPLKIEYKDLPWEIEAYNESPTLLKKMKDSLLYKK